MQFRSESNMQKASDLETQMSNEMQYHYTNVTALLTAEKKDWYDQSCNVSRMRPWQMCLPEFLASQLFFSNIWPKHEFSSTFMTLLSNQDLVIL